MVLYYYLSLFDGAFPGLLDHTEGKSSTEEVGKNRHDFDQHIGSRHKLMNQCLQIGR